MFSSLNPEKRLQGWRNVRSQNFSTAAEVASQFINIETVDRYIDCYSPDTWPSPFEIIHEGVFCPTSVTLILSATLFYLQFLESSDIIFPVISNNIDGSTGIVLQSEGLVYNFLPGEVVTEQYMRENCTVYQVHTLKTHELFR
jgi:hypothetical protein